MRRVPHIPFPFVGGDIVGGSHLSALKLIAALDPDRFCPRIVLHGAAGQLARAVEHAVPPLHRLLVGPGLRDRTAAAALGLDRFGTTAHLRRIQAVYAQLLNISDVPHTRTRHA